MHTCRHSLLVFGLLAVGLLAGCGGGSDSGNDTPSPYTGNYTGQFTTITSESGTVNISINTTGKIAGTINNTFANLQGAVSGKIDNKGNADITLSYPNVTARAKGVLYLNSSNHTLAGTLTQTVNGQTFATVAVRLEKDTPGSGNP